MNISFLYNPCQKWIQFSFLVFFLINSIYLLAFFPGTFTYDGYFQLTEFYGFRDWSNHLPVMATLIEGGIFNIGANLGGKNFGLFLYVFLQVLFQSYVFAYCIKIIAKLTKNFFLVVFSMVFFAINPLFPVCIVAHLSRHKGQLFLMNRYVD